MEKLLAYVAGKQKLLQFTQSKTGDIFRGKGNVLVIGRQREALSSMVASIELLKLQVEEAKFIMGDRVEAVTAWSKDIEDHVAEVDADITSLTKCLAELKAGDEMEAKETENALKSKEREENLEFERVQFEHKLEFELVLSNESYMATILLL